MKNRIIWCGFSLLLLLPVAFLVIIQSASGSRWFVQQVLTLLPAQTTVGQIEGSLLQRIDLTQLHYESVKARLDIGHLTFAWQPGQLIHGRLYISEITLNDIDMAVAPDTSEETTTYDWTTEYFLPLQSVLEKLTVRNLHFQSGSDHAFDLQQLNLSASSQQDQLQLQSLTIEATPIYASLSGKIQLGRQFPFELAAQWQLHSAEYGDWQASTRLQGDARHLDIVHQQDTPFQLTVNGQAENLQTDPLLKLSGGWQNLAWPLQAPEPQFRSAQGNFEVLGPLQDLRLKLDAPLTQEYLPGAQLNFAGRGNPQALHIDALQIASSVGGLKIDGNIDWQSTPQLALNASGKAFNPAIFLPQLPGKLTFDTYLEGSLNPVNPSLKLDLKALSGELRGSPIQASGQLSMADNTYRIDSLDIHSGRNVIRANGVLNPAQSHLTFDLDTPALAAFWPGLAGSLLAKGQLHGDWRHPALDIKAQCEQLQLNASKIGHLDLAIDYQPDRQKISSLMLNAHNIKSGDHAVSELSLLGKGNLQQHRFTLGLKSQQAVISAQLDGSVNPAHWQGRLSKFTLEDHNKRAWQLQTPVQINAKQQTQGLDVEVAQFCLTRNNAAFCANGRYQANQDFMLQLKATALPIALFQPWLVDGISLNGLVDAEADLKQQKGRQSGQYHIAIADGQAMVQTGDKRQALTFGPMHMAGNLNNHLLTAEADLGLMAEDFLRANLQLNTGTQGLAGNIQASISNWQLLRPYIPGIDLQSGHLQTNLKLQGNTASPEVSGQIDLHEAAVEIMEAGVTLKQLNLQAQATAGKGYRLLINGSAVPTLPPATHLQWQGKLLCSADLEFVDKGIRGQYRLDLPDHSSLSFANGHTSVQIPFAASSLKGEMQEEQISANLELLMQNQDYLRSRIRADIGRTEQLSGQIQASMQDLTLFNALIPQLSDIKGQLSANLALHGTLSQPTTQGALQLQSGAAKVDDLGLALTGIQLYLNSSGLNGEHLELNGKALSGEGQLDLHGVVRLDENKLDLALQGTDFEVAKRPDAQISISPDLKLSLNTAGVKASGQLLIPKAIIVMDDLPHNAVKVSEDEIILGQTEHPTKTTANLAVDAAIDVLLGQQVHFSGLGLSTDLSGKLKISQSTDNTSLHGTIDMKNGRYKSYGQDLNIRKGRFMFNGPVDAPWLDVEAIRVSKDQDVTAILSLSGPLKSPKTRIYSEPSLPEAEALAYLMTGSPLNQVSKADGSMVAGAALSYGVGKLSWLTEKLGVDEFEVKEGKTLNDTILSMGEYLTPDFYIGTKVGIFDKQALLVLRHKLTEHFKLETQAGTSQRVKINYEIDRD